MSINFWWLINPPIKHICVYVQTSDRLQESLIIKKTNTAHAHTESDDHQPTATCDRKDYT